MIYNYKWRTEKKAILLSFNHFIIDVSVKELTSFSKNDLNKTDTKFKIKITNNKN